MICEPNFEAKNFLGVGKNKVKEQMERTTVVSILVYFANTDASCITVVSLYF